jgi:hypothetical protein
MEKLEIMIKLASDRNIDQVFLVAIFSDEASAGFIFNV